MQNESKNERKIDGKNEGKIEGKNESIIEGKNERKIDGKNEGKNPGQKSALAQIFIHMPAEPEADHHCVEVKRPDHLAVDIVDMVVAPVVYGVKQNEIEHGNGDRHIFQPFFFFSGLSVDKLHQEKEENIEYQNGSNKMIVGRIKQKGKYSFRGDCAVNTGENKRSRSDPDRRINTLEPLEIPAAKALLGNGIKAVAGNGKVDHIT